jgi:uncharacterized protein YjiS (DUF1127 family)
MKRLSANEIATLRSDRPLTVTSDQTFALVQEARRLQAAALRTFVLKLSAVVADVTGVNLLAAKLRRAYGRRQTMAALAALSDRNLADIGLHRGTIGAKSVELSQESVPEVRGFWHRVARRWREDNDRRRTVQDLLAMDDRILADIGFERSQVWDYAEEMTRGRSLLSRAVASIASPIAALAEEFEVLFTRSLGYDRQGWEGKAPANDQHDGRKAA